METSEKVTDKVGGLLFTMVLSAALSFIAVLWIGFLPSSLISNFSFGVGCIQSFIPMPFILILLSLPLAKIKSLRTRVTPTVLAALYTVGLISSIYADKDWPLLQPGRAWISRYLSAEISSIVIPEFMAPPEAVASQIVAGHLPIPWADWAPSLIFWWLFAVLNGFFFLSINAIFRRQWIDVEKLPFPHTMLAYEFLIEASGPEPERRGLKKPLLLGLLVGFVLQFPIFMAAIFPWFPDIYGWRATCWFGGRDLTGVFPALTTSLAGLSFINIHPLAVAIFYVVPLITLFNLWFWFLVFVIFTQVAWYMGYYSGIEEANACCRSFVYYNQLPFRWSAVTAGGAMGIFILYMFTSRRYISETVRAALGRLGPNALKSIEGEEPVTYRVAYLMLATTSVLMFALWFASGLGPAAALLMPISLFMSCIVCARFFGTVGAPGGISTGLLFKGLYPGTAPWPPSREFGLGFYYSQFTWHWKGGGTPAVISAASFRMSSLTKAENKSIFKTYAVSQIVVPLFSLIGFLMVLYTWGTSGTGFGGYDMGTEPLTRYLNPTRVAEFPYPEPWFAQYVVGVILSGALAYMHSRFIWFPFEPIGFLLGLDWAGFGAFWGMAFAAWVAKVLTIRIGGSKAYEGYGLPFVSGFVFGYVIAVLLGGITSAVRFFVPF